VREPSFLEMLDCPQIANLSERLRSRRDDPLGFGALLAAVKQLYERENRCPITLSTGLGSSPVTDNPKIPPYDNLKIPPPVLNEKEGIANGTRKCAG
jgi:hypothetical protein